MVGVIDTRRYLEAYDDQLRTDAETPSAIEVDGLGPLRLVTFAGGRGFATVGKPGPGMTPVGGAELGWPRPG